MSKRWSLLRLPIPEHADARMWMLWQSLAYRGTGCPFCRNEDDHRLAVIAVEGQGGLRIDYCEQCRGYLKTYQGQGSEMVLLADWTSIQLDMIALDRGLRRVAAPST